MPKGTLMGRKPPPAPPGSVVAQAHDAIRALREAMADAKQQIRGGAAALQAAADQAADTLLPVVQEARELREGFRSLAVVGIAEVVTDLKSDWTTIVQDEMQRSLDAANKEIAEQMAKLASVVQAADTGLAKRRKDVDELVETLRGMLADAAATELFKLGERKLPQTIVRRDRADTP
jgi:hypothetical protein